MTAYFKGGRVSMSPGKIEEKTRGREGTETKERRLKE